MKEEGATIVRVFDTLPDGLSALVVAAEAEGYGHIARLRREWLDGVERFDGEGCVLLALYSQSDEDGAPRLAAIGGVSADPALRDALRMRRFYVRPECRRRGLGARLACALLQEALATGRQLTVHAGDGRAAAFWESQGFRPVADQRYSHAYG